MILKHAISNDEISLMANSFAGKIYNKAIISAFIRIKIKYMHGV